MQNDLGILQIYNSRALLHTWKNFYFIQDAGKGSSYPEIICKRRDQRGRIRLIIRQNDRLLSIDVLM